MDAAKLEDVDGDEIERRGEDVGTDEVGMGEDDKSPGEGGEAKREGEADRVGRGGRARDGDGDRCGGSDAGAGGSARLDTDGEACPCDDANAWYSSSSVGKERAGADTEPTIYAEASRRGGVSGAADRLLNTDTGRFLAGTATRNPPAGIPATGAGPCEAIPAAAPAVWGDPVAGEIDGGRTTRSGVATGGRVGRGRAGSGRAEGVGESAISFRPHKAFRLEPVDLFYFILF